MLRMEDEKGPDEKIICVPHERVHPQYSGVNDIEDLPAITRSAIEHFFERYKDLEPDKWVKVIGWSGKAEAEATILQAIAAAK
jgi:inorganic pyrophosphatase